MPDNLLNMAEEANRHVRSKMIHGAPNKVYGRRGPLLLPKQSIPLSKQSKDSVANRAAHRDTVLEQLRPTRTGRSEFQWAMYGERAMNFGLGHCDEQTASAFAFLRRQCYDANIPIDIVELVDPGDHIFLVLGQATFLRGATTNQPYPKYFSVWSWECVICDVWAKIVCHAPEYPRLWRDKMYKWDSRGMTIHGISPIDPRWFNCLEAHHKVSLVEKTASELRSFRSEAFSKPRAPQRHTFSRPQRQPSHD